MFDNDSGKDYLERAAMHEQLAAATADDQARKMHQAMAAAYRRKAAAQQTMPVDMTRPSPSQFAATSAY